VDGVGSREKTEETMSDIVILSAHRTASGQISWAAVGPVAPEIVAFALKEALAREGPARGSGRGPSWGCTPKPA